MYQIATQPAQQRTATVGVNANAVNVGVANTMAMTTGGTVPGQTAVNQAQLALGVTSAVPNAVLQSATSPTTVSPYGASGGGGSAIGNVQPVTQTNSRKSRFSRALAIIDPKTNRSIFDIKEDKVLAKINLLFII